MRDVSRNELSVFKHGLNNSWGTESFNTYNITWKMHFHEFTATDGTLLYMNAGDYNDTGGTWGTMGSNYTSIQAYRKASYGGNVFASEVKHLGVSYGGSAVTHSGNFDLLTDYRFMIRRYQNEGNSTWVVQFRVWTTDYNSPFYTYEVWYPSTPIEASFFAFRNLDSSSSGYEYGCDIDWYNEDFETEEGWPPQIVTTPSGYEFNNTDGFYYDCNTNMSCTFSLNHNLTHSPPVVSFTTDTGIITILASNLNEHIQYNGSFWFNITATNTLYGLSCYQNFTLNYTYINQSYGKEWGFDYNFNYWLEKGTHDYTWDNDTNGFDVCLGIDENSNIESVVLQDYLVVSSIATYHINETHIRAVLRDTDNAETGFIASVELASSNNNSYYDNSGWVAPRNSEIVHLKNANSEILASVGFFITDDVESIQIYNGTSWSKICNWVNWAKQDTKINSTYPYVMQNEYYQNNFHRYIVQFEYSFGINEVKIIIDSTAEDGILYNNNISVSKSIDKYQNPFIDFQHDATNYEYDGNLISDSWMIFDISYRGLDTEYLRINPYSEMLEVGNNIWIAVYKWDNTTLSTANVDINFGSGWEDMSYNSLEGRYEHENLLSSIAWGNEVWIKVTYQNYTKYHKLYYSIVGNNVSLWWNGWDFATAFGVDDCSGLMDGVNYYSAYNHPVISYIISSTPTGLATVNNDIVENHAEIGYHYPHTYTTNDIIFWTDAISSANSSMTNIKADFTYASIWDNASYVGSGDTYLSWAYPGNLGTIQLLNALYDEGFKIATVNWISTSTTNYFIDGSYCPDGSIQNYPQAFYPNAPIFLMNHFRQNIESSINDSHWNNIKYIASHGGMVEVYTHGSISSSGAILASWLNNTKSNYSYENWKATPGEIASYIFGRYTTYCNYNYTSDTNIYFDVSRTDPRNYGYWLVPITLEFDLAEMNLTESDISNITVNDGINNITLSDLSGARIMDIGYDIRGTKLYVSYFWNESTTLSLELEGAWEIVQTVTTNISIYTPVWELVQNVSFNISVIQPIWESTHFVSTQIHIIIPLWEEVSNFTITIEILIPIWESANFVSAQIWVTYAIWELVSEIVSYIKIIDLSGISTMVDITIYFVMLFLPALILNTIFGRIGFISGLALMSIVLGLRDADLLWLTIMSLVGCFVLIYKGD